VLDYLDQTRCSDDHI